MASGSGQPTGSRQRKHTNPPATSAVLSEPPQLPDHLRNGPGDDKGESEAKRPRSTSNTPKSGKAFDLDEFDR